VQETNQNLIQKLYGSKSDSEIEFEEEPRTAVITDKILITIIKNLRKLSFCRND
jgi:hypothetical protein